jgi:hypothetical protein
MPTWLHATRDLYDDSRVLYAFRKAPEVFADAIDKWMNKERISFLGKSMKQSVGAKGIRGKLLNKSLFGNRMARFGIGWSPQTVGQFVSYKRNKKTLDLEMTMEFAKDSPLKKAMEIDETGGTVNSSKFMPIPMYRNLLQVGVTSKFNEDFKDRDLTPIKSKGDPNTLLWFYNKNGFRLLAYVGKKQTRIHKQFDFHRTWERRHDSVINRGQKACDTATRKVESLIDSGEISGL